MADNKVKELLERANPIIKNAKTTYEFLRRTESEPTPTEQYLFDICCICEQLFSILAALVEKPVISDAIPFVEKAKKLLEKIDTVFMRCMWSLVGDSNKLGEYADLIDQALSALDEKPVCETCGGTGKVDDWVTDKMCNTFPCPACQQRRIEELEKIIVAQDEDITTLQNKFTSYDEAIRAMIKNIHPDLYDGAIKELKRILGDRFEEVINKK